MSSFGGVRKVRREMSAAVGHDVRKLIAQLNARRDEVRPRIITPNARAETCDRGHEPQKSIPVVDPDRSGT